jgi:hypothetical protein
MARLSIPPIPVGHSNDISIRGLLAALSGAAVLGVLIYYVVATHRRARNLKCGRCGVCGYDLTANASGVCPECGGLAPEPVLRPGIIPPH